MNEATANIEGGDQEVLNLSKIKFIAVCSKGTVAVENTERFFDVAKSSSHWKAVFTLLNN